MNTRKYFYPVLHYAGIRPFWESVDTAIDSGVDGVFLINQGITAKALLAVAKKVTDFYPDLWVGINMLGSEPTPILCELYAKVGIKGVWLDHSGIGPQGVGEQAYKNRKCTQKMGLQLFGGVAFKYQETVPDAVLSEVASLAAPFMDVVVTSGPSTGNPASMYKVKSMTGDGYSLGLASGVSTDNINHFLPYVDHFLVASSIEQIFGKLDPVKTKELAAAIHGDDS